jgi:hypothetical protein
MTGTHHHPLLFSVEMGSSYLFLPRLATNYDPPNVSLPSRQDDRCEPPASLASYTVLFYSCVPIKEAGFHKSPRGKVVRIRIHSGEIFTVVLK